jgi:aldose 1-epimerase
MMNRNICMLLLVASMGFSAAAETQVTKAKWGDSSDQQSVMIYTLKSPSVEVRVMSYGAKIVSIRTPDRAGTTADITLGYNSLPEYLADKRTHFGAVVGRFANRIANGTFTLDGTIYHIPLNNGHNALHGGTIGFDQKVWQDREIPHGVEFTLISQDGDMGFPGTLTAKIRYTLQGDVLRLDYFATTSKTTVVNLTNHSYFNLGGNDKRDILSEAIQINADHYTPVNAELIPLGEIAPVAGTPFDLRHSTLIGAHIHDTNEQIRLVEGYDHNYVLNGEPGQIKLAAKVYDPESGRTLIVSTTEPGVQFYSGSHLDGAFIGRYGTKYEKYAGLCLETQHFPDSPNQSSFPTTVLKVGEQMHSTTTYRFGILKAGF